LDPHGQWICLWNGSAQFLLAYRDLAQRPRPRPTKYFGVENDDWQNEKVFCYPFDPTTDRYTVLKYRVNLYRHDVGSPAHAGSRARTSMNLTFGHWSTPQATDAAGVVSAL
jgi:hypothetical protein